MIKVFSFLGLCTLLVFADAPVLKTGQVKSYDANSNEVIDGSIKDDGYYKMGLDHDYARAGSTVIDATTGLEWEDDTTNTSHGFNQAAAINRCNNLTLDDKLDWRLPTVKELATIVDRSRLKPALDPIFLSIPENNDGETYYGFYWSSTEVPSNTNTARSVDFYDGYSPTGPKSGSGYRVRCVRDIGEGS